MQRDHLRLHRSLAVLGPPRRFQLMLLLLTGVERSVSQLAKQVRLSQSCTTRHLQALERAGLVKGVRDGKRVVFRPAPRDLTARGVVAWLQRNAHEVDDGAALLAAGLAAGAIAIDSTAELEPLPESYKLERPRPGRRRNRPPSSGPVVIVRTGDDGATDVQVEDATPDAEGSLPPTPPDEPESGNTSDPPDDPPAWRSSDIEDFLL